MSAPGRLFRRRTGAALAVLAALVGAAALSVFVAERERASALGYAAARARQDRAAHAAPLAAPPARRAGARQVCARGADTLARALARSRKLRLVDERGALDPTALARLSSLALSAERRAERETGGPALPQRMGRQRVTDKDGRAIWQPLEPTRRPCAPLPERARRGT
jgi:hypothetical protein